MDSTLNYLAKTAINIGSTVTTPVQFVSSFFSNTKVISAIKAEAFQKSGDNVLQYLSLEEALNFSACSHFTSSVNIGPGTAQNFLSKSKASHLGKIVLTLNPAAMTLGNFRRVLFRLIKCSEATVSIDYSTGRVLLDLGSAYKDHRAFVEANAVIMVQAPNGAEEDSEPILKYLEVTSCDEYDDFNPRHPNPKDIKGHRRGDSYFNSDIEAIAKEALSGALDLTAMAKEAAALEKLAAGKTKATGRTSRVQSKLGITALTADIEHDAHASSDEEDDSKPEPQYF